MAEFFQSASDDQLALVICFSAVTVCGLIMHFSHHVGRLTGHIRLHDASRDAARQAAFAQRASSAIPAEAHSRDKAA